MAYFKKAAQVLKAGGVFVFLVTNFRSLSSRCLFREDVPRHLCFFTEVTIGRHLEESSFDFIKADYTDKIYSMRPINFLRYYFYRYIKKQRLKWRQAQYRSAHSSQKNTLRNPIIRKLMHLIFDPIDVIDQLLLPIYERYQIISKTYGIVTYVARKH
jgi:hypothetical protein